MKRRNTLFSNSRNLYADYLIKKSKEDLFDGEYDGKQFLSIMQSKVSYRVPKGYISWNKLVEIFTCVLIENIIEEKKPGLIGGAEIRNARSIMEWFDTKSPLFIVESSLIDVFVESKMTECDIDFFRNLLSGLDNLYPNLILLFPSNCAHLFHEYTGNVDYCVITYMTSDKPICKIDGNTLETNSCVHLSGITKKAKILDNLFITTNNDLQMDWNHTDELSLILFKIVAQCLLLIASKPELVITSDQIKSFNHETSGQGFQKPKYGEKVLYPRVLNLSYAEKKSF